MNSDTISKVAAGAAFLDENYPGWEHHIDLGKLDLSRTTDCMLGQIGRVIGQSMGCYVNKSGFLTLAGELYNTGDGYSIFENMFDDTFEQTGDSMVSLGFDVDLSSEGVKPDDSLYRFYVTAYAILDEAWTALIKERFSSGNLSDMKADA